MSRVLPALLSTAALLGAAAPAHAGDLAIDFGIGSRGGRAVTAVHVGIAGSSNGSYGPAYGRPPGFVTLRPYTPRPWVVENPVHPVVCDPCVVYLPPHEVCHEESVCVPPVYEVCTRPVYEDRCVPVYEDVCVPVYEDRCVPVYETICVPIYRTVCDPRTGREHRVHVGDRQKRVKVGDRHEQVKVGERHETVRTGDRHEQVQVGTRNERVLVQAESTRVVVRSEQVAGRYVTLVTDPVLARRAGPGAMTPAEYAAEMARIAPRRTAIQVLARL